MIARGAGGAARRDGAGVVQDELVASIERVAGLIAERYRAGRRCCCSETAAAQPTRIVSPPS
jgi:hypothetical protein